MKKTNIISVLFYLTFLNLVFAQPKSNLDVIYNLIDKNVDQLLRKLPHETEPFLFSYSSPNEYGSFENMYIHKLNETGFLSADTTSDVILNYSLDKVKVEYSDLFREDILGGYNTKRNISLRGTFVFKKNSQIINSGIVETAYTDTIPYFELENLENSRLAITRGTKPDEPVFESLLEPVIAVGAVIVTIILLFTVRSK